MEQKNKISRPRYDIEGRYSAILSAGEYLLCNSYDDAQPQLIAKTAGVSVGLFYRHFKNKQELLAAIMVHRLGILHENIIREIEQITNPIDTLKVVLFLTLQYFQTHQGLIKLFFMQIGYGNAIATKQLADTRQNYRNILENILRSGMNKKLFLAENKLDVEIAINCIIGTINWTLYDTLVVKNENIDAYELANKLSSHILRSLLRS
jgi:AcrR family transcriptional regulator